MKRYWTFLVVPSALTLASVALAHGAGHPGRGAGFSHLDQNGDGKITLAEATAAKDKHFAELDANKDGVVTLEETQSWKQAKKQKHAEARFAERDANKDGKLSRDEVPRMPAERFQAIDANRDGFLTRDEFSSAKGPRGKGQGPRGAGFFARIDRDGDGKVSQTEANAAVKAMFEKKDTNRDGALTRDEWGKGHHRGEGKKHGGAKKSAR